MYQTWEIFHIIIIKLLKKFPHNLLRFLKDFHIHNPATIFSLIFLATKSAAVVQVQP